ncbi:MFS transporter [Chloroflexota bacterium]
MKIKLFYGWYIVVAGLVLATYNSWIFVYGWTAFLNPILATFGWSMTQIALASSLRGIETGVLNPIWGTAIDRWPAGNLMRFGLIITALGVFCLSQTRNLAMFYGGFLIMGMGTSLVTGIILPTVIARWFRRDIGKANGLLYTGWALGGVLIRPLVTIIDKVGWQNTLFCSAIGFLVIGIPLSFVFRSWPAEYGLLPDGKPEDPTKESEYAPSSSFGTSIKEALRMRAFWHLIVVIMYQQAYLSALTAFSMPYLSSLGMMRTTATTIIMAYTVFSLISRIPIGFLSDIFRKSYVVALSVGLQTIGLLSFWLMVEPIPFWLVAIFAVSYGVGIAGVLALRGPIIADYFGRKNFGAILGLTSIFATAAGVVSTPLAGWIWDTQHSYKVFWLAGVAFGLAALVSILTIPPSIRRVKEATS